MKIHRIFPWLGLLFILPACIICGCSAPGAAPHETPATPALTPVKVAYMPITSFGPIFIAKDEGYFEQQGLDVELVRFQATSEALPLLLKGDIAVSGGTLSPGIINAAADGARIRLVADKGTILSDSCNSQGIVVRRDLVESGAVKGIADLRGRKIASTSDQSYNVRRALALGNLTTDDVSLIDMPRPSILAALQNKALDAAFLMEPVLSQATRNNSSVVILGGYAATPNLSSPLIYGPAFTDANPDLGRRFMAAYLLGVREYNQGKTVRNLAILANYTQMDREDMNMTCWVTIAPDGEFPGQPIQDYMDWMLAEKKISRTVPVDQLVDMSYARGAAGVLPPDSTQHP